MDRPRDHIQRTTGLTKVEHDAAIDQTYLGQAHIAGTGPSGATCRECKFWHLWKKDEDGETVPASPGYYSKKAVGVAPCSIKRALCNRPIANKSRRRIPHGALSCRLFEAADNPPAAIKVQPEK